MISLLRFLPRHFSSTGLKIKQYGYFCNLSQSIVLRQFFSFSSLQAKVSRHLSYRSLAQLSSTKIEESKINQVQETIRVDPLAPTLLDCNASFESVLQQDIFADKTLMIKQVVSSSLCKEIMHLSRRPYLLFWRPDGWGKSTLLDMLKNYLKIEVNLDGTRKYQSTAEQEGNCSEFNLQEKRKHKPLFYLSANEGKELKIAKEKEIECQHMGEWPVITLKLPEFTQTQTLEQMKIKLKRSISEAFRQHSYLIRVWQASLAKSASGEVEKIEQKIRYFNELVSNEGQRMLDLNISSSIASLSSYLSDCFGRKSFILIDSFDLAVF